jgi:preprotein translocase subunit YajC
MITEIFDVLLTDRLLTLMNKYEFILAQVAPSTGPVSTQSQSAAVPNGVKPEPASGVMTMLLPLLLIVGLYVLFMRPQYKKEKQLQTALKGLAKGDRVVSRGGLWGTIVGFKEDEGIVVVKIADDVKVEISRSAIEQINPQAKAAQKEKKAEKKK